MATTLERIESLHFQESYDEISPVEVCETIKKFLKVKHDAEIAEIHAQSVTSSEKVIIEPGPFDGFYSTEAYVKAKEAELLANLAHQLLEKSGVTIEVDSSEASAYVIEDTDFGSRIKDEKPENFEADQFFGNNLTTDFYNSRTHKWLRVEEGDIYIKPAA